MLNKEKQIAIKCLCNITYFSNRNRFHKCLNCGRIWDLRPDLPKYIKPTLESLYQNK